MASALATSPFASPFRAGTACSALASPKARRSLCVHQAQKLDADGAQPPSDRKQFTWPFRRFLSYEGCAFTPPDQPKERGVTLTASRTSEIDLSVHGDALFALSSTPSTPSAPPASPLLTIFDPFRVADDQYGDADGDITLDELECVPWTDPLSPDPSSGTTPRSTLGARVYLDLLPALVRYRGGNDCTIHTSEEDPEDGGPF
jgi:hypothetical protein